MSGSPNFPSPHTIACSKGTRSKVKHDATGLVMILAKAVLTTQFSQLIPRKLPRDLYRDSTTGPRPGPRSDTHNSDPFRLTGGKVRGLERDSHHFRHFLLPVVPGQFERSHYRAGPEALLGLSQSSTHMSVPCVPRCTTIGGAPTPDATPSLPPPWLHSDVVGANLRIQLVGSPFLMLWIVYACVGVCKWPIEGRFG